MQIDPSFLPSPFDRDKADETINEVLNRLEAAGTRPSGATETMRDIIAALAGNSPYLARALVLHCDLLPTLLAQGADAVFDSEMACLRADAEETETADALMSCLRRAKGRIALLVAIADIGGVWPLEDVTRRLSAFAEAVLEMVVAHLLQARMAKGDLAWPGDTVKAPGSGLAKGSGFFVLGLGKLGAHELNYSSDIDLIVLYDEEIARYRGKRSLSDCMIRMTQELVRILEARTGEGYVFRTDLRLRPDPGATPVALSVGAAETYYQSVALNWERAAMIKARVVAGDREAGTAYLERLAPFVWRRSLDFAAIEDIHAIKDQIHRHHGHGGFRLEGFDIKLGPGAIREVEFYAQTNQLIAGGREPRLRKRDTLGALRALVAADRVSDEVAVDLEAAYRFYRTLEHRLQMIDDAQTHTLPASRDGLRHVALFMGFPDIGAFEACLRRHLEAVQHHYDRLLPRELAPREGLDESDLLALFEKSRFGHPESALTIVDRWRRGRYRALRSPRARKLLEATLPGLVESFAATAEPDRAFARFDAFLSQLPQGVQLFALFQSNPSLFRLVGRIMGVAPALADQLAKRAQLIDALLDPEFFSPLPDRTRLSEEFDAALGRARHYEDVLDIARRWTSERRFQLGVQTLEAVADIREASEAMTDLADVVVTCLEREVRNEYAKRHGRFPGGHLAVLAMGKFGGRELSFGSDLDLVLLYDVEGEATESVGPRPVGPSRYFSGLGQALVTACTTMTAEGRLWEVDTRLRPSGKAGPLVVTLETFADYYAHSAWTWEHMALTRARIVSAPETLAERIEATIRRTLTVERDDAALLPAVAKMRARLAREFATDNPWNVKHVRGGLVDMEFVAQYLLLRHGARHPEIFTPRLDDCFDNLASIGALEAADVDLLKRAHGLYHAVQSLLRLTLPGEPDETAFVPELKAAIARCAGEERFEDVVPSLTEAQGAVRAIFAAVIGDPPDDTKTE